MESQAPVPANILPAIKSNRIVTRDLRRAELKALLEENKLASDLLQQLVELKTKKYQFMGILPATSCSKTED